MANRDYNKIKRTIGDFSQNITSNTKPIDGKFLTVDFGNFFGELTVYNNGTQIPLIVTKNPGQSSINTLCVLANIPANATLNCHYSLVGDEVSVFYNDEEVVLFASQDIDFDITVSKDGYLKINDSQVL